MACMSLIISYLVWAHTLEIFAVNRIPTSGSLKVWLLVFFINQLISYKFFPTFVLETNKRTIFHQFCKASIQTNLNMDWFSFVFLTNCTGNFTDINLVWRHELLGGCCQYYFQKTPKILCKRLKMTNNHLRLISLSNFIKLMRNYWQRHRTSQAVPPGKNTTGQYYCEQDLEIEVYL